MPRPLLLALFLSLFVSRVGAQAHWERQAGVGSRASHVAGYDEARDKVVVFGGRGEFYQNDVWEWDGASWSPGPPNTAWSGIFSPRGIAYDPAQQRLVIAIQGTGNRSELWTYDGADWAPMVEPPGVSFYVDLAYDRGRSQLVLVGGGRGQETWTWDGASWTLRHTAPFPVQVSKFAYDEARGVCVSYSIGPAWEWDGAAWHARTPLASPPPRNGQVTAYDPVARRVVIYGGGTAGLDDVWEWDGASWIERRVATRPEGRFGTALTRNIAGDALILICGDTGGALQSDVWRLRGNSWTPIEDLGGPARQGHAFGFDSTRGVALLFGGETPDGALHAETWQRSGMAWSRLSPGAAPSARSDVEWAYDRVRSRFVLFGGRDASGLRGDTWEWDGATWVEVTPASSPTPRTGHGMSYDMARGRVTLFGGTTAQGNSSETWEWDGAAWTLRGSGFPPASAEAELVYDSRRERSLLVIDGIGGTEVWTRDAGGWRSTAPSIRPPLLSSRTAVYDVARDRLVLVGMQGVEAQTWEWDGANWEQVGAPSYVLQRGKGLPLAYEESEERVIAYGGAWLSSVFPTHAWFYATDSPARVESYGSGCGAPIIPSLSATGRPWLGDTIELEAVALPPATQGFVVLGASNTTWSGVPLPFALPGPGACSLLAGLDILAQLGPSQTLSLSVPSDPLLAGGHVYAQALAFGPFTVAASAGLDLLVGIR